MVQAQGQPVAAILDVCRQLDSYLSAMEQWQSNDHDLLIEVVTFIDAISTANNFDGVYDLPELTGDIRSDCDKMIGFIRNTEAVFRAKETQAKLELHKSNFHMMFTTGFVYEFSEGDINRLQELINELRAHIRDSTLFTADHQQRLLKRLENLQSELHKRMSDIDKFWGLVGDAGVALGKFGTDAKPIVDRIKEIAQIGWRTQARAEELPSDCQNPLLGHDGD
jgi:hypothetical protein